MRMDFSGVAQREVVVDASSVDVPHMPAGREPPG
jgi:hypothetical protein